MATDDERRRVAAALRAIKVPAKVKKTEHPESTAAWYELLCKAVGGKKDPWFGIKTLANRLADLIEPGDMSQSCRDTVACDRGALLALADELANVRRWSCYTDSDLLDIADRIREACGEASEG